MDGWAKIFLAQDKIASESARRADHWYTGISPPPPSKRVRLGNFGGFRWTSWPSRLVLRVGCTPQLVLRKAWKNTKYWFAIDVRRHRAMQPATVLGSDRLGQSNNKCRALLDLLRCWWSGVPENSHRST